MKKISIAILIFLFSATMITYAGLINDRSENKPKEDTSDSRGGFFSGSDSETEANDQYGGFFGAPPGPGDRPDDGGGIGQENPPGDGLTVLIFYCLAFGLIVFISNKQKKIK